WPALTTVPASTSRRTILPPTRKPSFDSVRARTSAAYSCTPPAESLDTVTVRTARIGSGAGSFLEQAASKAVAASVGSRRWRMAILRAMQERGREANGLASVLLDGGRLLQLTDWSVIYSWEPALSNGIGPVSREESARHASHGQCES